MVCEVVLNNLRNATKDVMEQKFVSSPRKLGDATKNAAVVVMIGVV